MIHFALKNKKPILIIGAAVVAFLVVSLVYFRPASAVPGLPFGGFVYNVTYCTCPGSAGSALVHVSPPVPGDYLYVPWRTIVYPYFQIPRPLVWLLGDFFPGGACWMVVSVDPLVCAPLPAIGTINFVGTSL